jgi:hypothetical protein
LSRIAGNGENGAHEPVQEKVSVAGTEAFMEFVESFKIECVEHESATSPSPGCHPVDVGILLLA